MAPPKTSIMSLSPIIMSLGVNVTIIRTCVVQRVAKFISSYTQTPPVLAKEPKPPHQSKNKTLTIAVRPRAIAIPPSANIIRSTLSVMPIPTEPAEGRRVTFSD
jgi:hypothetical protein